MRIVYIIDTLSTKGGAERIISEKMNYMATRYGYDVSIITCYQFPDSMPNCYYLSDKVKQINLCIPLHEQYRHPYPQRLLDRWGYIRHDGYIPICPIAFGGRGVYIVRAKECIN